MVSYYLIGVDGIRMKVYVFSIGSCGDAGFEFEEIDKDLEDIYNNIEELDYALSKPLKDVSFDDIEVILDVAKKVLDIDTISPCNLIAGLMIWGIIEILRINIGDFSWNILSESNIDESLDNYEEWGFEVIRVGY